MQYKPLIVLKILFEKKENEMNFKDHILSIYIIYCSAVQQTNHHLQVFINLKIFALIKQKSKKERKKKNAI